MAHQLHLLYILPVIMAVNEQQQKFLEQIAACIPRLFEAIKAGNVKSEFYIGLKRIGNQQVQLKMVAEVLDPGDNPLKTHGMQAPVLVEIRLTSDNQTEASAVLELDTPPDDITSGNERSE